MKQLSLLKRTIRRNIRLPGAKTTTLIGKDNQASRRSISSISAEQTLPTDPGAFNVEIETDADGIIDFSEGNPFGEAT